jgi:hypothetical protein
MRRVALVLAAVVATGCRDLSSFSTGTGSFAGGVVNAAFVRVGVAADTQMCLTLDANHFQDGPGVVSTKDGRFSAVPFRPIPQIWSDPLSTLTFGEGRLRSFIYVISASTSFGDGNGNDVIAVLSLMQAGGVEVRLLRGAPPIVPSSADGGPEPEGAPFGDVADAGDAGDGGDGGTAPGNLFAIFSLGRQETPCSY